MILLSSGFGLCSEYYGTHTVVSVAFIGKFEGKSGSARQTNGKIGGQDFIFF
jgi:hypothetical protein